MTKDTFMTKPSSDNQKGLSPGPAAGGHGGRRRVPKPAPRAKLETALVSGPEAPTVPQTSPALLAELAWGGWGPQSLAVAALLALENTTTEAARAAGLEVAEVDRLLCDPGFWALVGYLLAPGEEVTDTQTILAAGEALSRGFRPPHEVLTQPVTAVP